MKNTRIVGNEGIECHSCGRKTQIREHSHVSNKQLRQPFYYSRWFYCFNKDCKTTLIMRDEFKVLNNNGAGASYREAHAYHEEKDRQLDFLQSI